MLLDGRDKEDIMNRYDRIASEMRKVISDILRNDVKDPRIPMMTSILDVKVTRDLKYAKVYVSVFGSEADKVQTGLALKNSAGYVRHRIGEKMIIRAVPELTFIIDESIERGAYMNELIKKVASEGGMGGSAENDKK